MFGKHEPRILRKANCWLCGDDRQKAVVFWLVIVPANKSLRLFNRRHGNLFLLILASNAKLFGFAFDHACVVLQIVDLFLQVQILRSDLVDLGIQIFILLNFAT